MNKNGKAGGLLIRCSPFVDLQREGDGMAIICRVECGGGLNPGGLLPFWEVCVRRETGMHLGQVETVGAVQSLREDLPTADDEELAFTPAVGQLEGFIKGMGCQDALGRVVRVTREEDGRAPGKGFADGFVRLAAHHQMMAHGEGLELLKVVREMPGDATLEADPPLLIHGDD